MADTRRIAHLTETSPSYREIALVPTLEQPAIAGLTSSCHAELFTEYEAPHRRFALSAAAVLEIVNKNL